MGVSLRSPQPPQRPSPDHLVGYGAVTSPPIASNYATNNVMNGDSPYGADVSPQQLQENGGQPTPPPAMQMQPSPPQQQPEYNNQPPPRYEVAPVPEPYVDPMEAPLRGNSAQGGGYSTNFADEASVPPPSSNLHSSNTANNPMDKTGGRMGRNIQYNDNMDSEEEVRECECEERSDDAAHSAAASNAINTPCDFLVAVRYLHG